MKESNKNNYIETKQNYEWHLMRSYLEGVKGFPSLKTDDKFFKLFNELFDYVESKLDLPTSGDIIDLYVTVIHEP